MYNLCFYSNNNVTPTIERVGFSIASEQWCADSLVQSAWVYNKNFKNPNNRAKDNWR